MAFTIEFDDNRLTERIREPYISINEVRPMGMSFVDFISLGEEVRKADHVYFKLVEEMSGRVTPDSYFYTQMKEFLDLCIIDPFLYTMENLMFFLHLSGLSVPQQHLEYHFDESNPVEDLIKNKTGMSSFEVAVRGFAKSDKSKNVITCVYTCDSIEDICMATLYHLLKLGLVIKKCNNCGKYFIPLRRSDAVYCDRPSPYNPSKTCKEDGSHRTFEEKLKMDDAESLRRQIYLAKRMRIRRNPDITAYKESFDKWNTEVSKWKEEIKKGHKTSEEFIQWLNESKKKY
jgi:hypothetical protein